MTKSKTAQKLFLDAKNVQRNLLDSITFRDSQAVACFVFVFKFLGVLEDLV